MLSDIDEVDRRDEGVQTAAKIDSIRWCVEFGDENTTPEWLAEIYSVSVEDVNRVIAAMK